MMDYGGGDLLLVGAAGCWVTAHVCVQTLGGDLNMAWRLSFSDESALEVSVAQDTLYKSTSYYYTLLLHLVLFNCLFFRSQSRLGQNLAAVFSDAQPTASKL